MTSDHEAVKAALDRRFSRLVVPPLPNRVWAVPQTTAFRARRRSRALVYASAFCGVLALAEVTAQASDALRSRFEQLLGRGSTQPLPPMIHAADRLTIAQAQQRVPFTIVEPAGLPEHTTFQYASVARKSSIASVELMYQARIDGRYYRIPINEATAERGPLAAKFEVVRKGKDGRLSGEAGTMSVRRWKHGTLIMETVPVFPSAALERIVRENTVPE